MIEAVMYGMIPRANTASLASAPPENRSRKPSTPAPLCWKIFLSASGSIPGTGT